MQISCVTRDGAYRTTGLKRVKKGFNIILLTIAQSSLSLSGFPTKTIRIFLQSQDVNEMINIIPIFDAERSNGLSLGYTFSYESLQDSKTLTFLGICLYSYNPDYPECLV
jgi:hypothetical protein